MKKIALFIISLYQLFLRPVLGKNCRFYPSCSEYAKESIQTHGIIHGVFLSIQRIIKCGPWHPGGYDPVKKTSKENEHQ